MISGRSSLDKQFKRSRVTFLVVSYGSSVSVPHLACSLLSQSVPEWSAIVVHNGGGAFPMEQMPEIGNRVKVLFSPKNLGYFGGANYALSSAVGMGLSPDWWVISNHDVSYHSEFVSELISLSDETNRVIAPSVVDVVSGIDANPYMLAPPSLMKSLIRAVAFSTTFTGNAAYRWHAKAPLMTKGEKKFDTRIFAPYGASIAIGAKALQTGITLNGAPHLFGEEVFLAEQCAVLAIPIFYRSKLQVRHKSHTTTQELMSKHRLQMQRQFNWDYLLSRIASRVFRG